ncbi:MAG: enoyl-[acyl-carrier-protein] reductase FabK [Bacillota bacterium]|jgi:enoyl-[acyl-carrier protein] reductase II
MLSTRICRLLKIDYPIFQGGMAWVATGELAAAVSQAGGLGIIGSGNAPPEVVIKEIKKVKDITDKPFGVNIYYLSPYVEEIIKLVIEERVPVVTTGAGNPGKHIPALKAVDIKVIPVVSSPVLARRLERAGADAFIAEGIECGGHVGDITTMVLVPQVVDAVSVPVIAAGGIYDGRGLVAALALGAVGVQIGTRFICATECTAHDNYKQAVIKAKDRDTVLTGMEGHQVRVLKNRLSKQFEALHKRHASEEEFMRLGSGRLKAAVVDGDVEMGSLMVGQVASLVKKIQPAAEIIEEIMSQASGLLKNLNPNNDLKLG